jgi:Domain of unknown function (DUF6484)
VSKPLAVIPSNAVDAVLEEGSSILQDALDATDWARSQPAREPDTTHPLNRALIGKLLGFRAGKPLIDFPASPSGAPVPARSAIPLSAIAIGREVVLVFLDADYRRPIIIGLMQDNDENTTVPADTTREERESKVDVEIDGERLLFTAEREIVLRCGKASITLTRAGKVLIRGAYLLNRSSGVNRIKGGSVQIN